MAVDREQVENIFNAAMALDVTARSTYLDIACRDDSELHARVEALLASHDAADSFMAHPLHHAAAVGALDCPAPPVTEGPGARIGRYKLLERIGEGGFGVVYMAEQQAPVRRKVALKVLKPGMDSRQVLARFDAERQALAIMDHPNIAKVFDGGMTDSGRPYFAMELVKGVPITEFCDQQQLPPRQRLELFAHVCHAVQHAHQKGIIHRDIKPTNVLVIMHDATPVVKVIDFGVAKALGQELTEKTLFTGFAQLLGTPLYMSPEQAGQSAIDVDTRSDIYSLGVLLYELLTGTTPFDKERFKTAAQDEIRRIIREEEPPTPSMRLSHSKDSLASISAQRHTEPAKLTKLVRGELDWIVMKALEKDRNRRYETANAFATDVQRYLANEPVLACPPSTTYRFRKFIRRNQVGVVAGSAIVAALTIGLGLSTWMYLQERQAHRRAVAAEQEQTRLRQQAEVGELISRVGLLASREQFEEADALLAPLSIGIPTSRDSAAVFRFLGDWHALHDRWTPAAARLAVVRQVNSLDGWDARSLDDSSYAAALVELGDRIGYERLRGELVPRVAADPQQLACAERIVKLSLLLPADPTTLQRLAPLLEAAINVGPDDYVTSPWLFLSCALLEYRQGEYQRSIERCRRTLDSRPQVMLEAPSRTAAFHVILGMSLHQLERDGDAVSELNKGRTLIETAFKRGIARDEGVQGYWFDWVVARILLREAEELFKEESAGVAQDAEKIPETRIIPVR
jgi:serine/threonine protein kinase